MAQLAAKDRNIFRVLVVFAAFFILTAPAVAGSQTRSFFTFVGDAASSFMTYLDGVFADPASTTTPAATAPAAGVTVVVPTTTP